MKLVSIIIPCFNQGEFLADTLASVLKQCYTNWQCVIVNDGSEDRTEEIALEWCRKDSRFIYYSQLNQGVSVARNNGIFKSNGFYILPLDADDLIHENYILEAVLAFESNQNIKLVYFNGRKFGLESSAFKLNKFNYRDLLIENMIVCSALFKKADFLDTSGYDKEMQIGLEDWEFWIRFLNENSQVVQIDKEYFFYRIRKSSRNSIPLDAYEEIKWQIFYKNFEIYKTHFIDPISQIKLAQTNKEMFQLSVDYRLGNFLINPFRKIKKRIFSK